jgi:hypothetical protein
MISPVNSSARLAHPAHPNSNPNANPNHLLGLSFSASNAPEQKGFLKRKVVPVIKRVGTIAGKVSDVAGKVAVVASIL